MTALLGREAVLPESGIMIGTGKAGGGECTLDAARDFPRCYALAFRDTVADLLSMRLFMGGILALALAIGIVFGARKLCDLIGAPLWFAKYLFICAALITAYFLAEGVVPNKPWAVWLAMLGAATGIIPVGFIVFKHIAVDDRKARDSSE